MQLSIGGKLGAAFGLVIVLMLIMVSVVYVKVGDMNASVDEVVQESIPTVNACQQLRNGVTQSISALRGYIILGADPRQGDGFRANRAEAWAEIDRALTLLQTFSGTWTDANDRERVEELGRALAKMKGAQDRTEEIAHHKENRPAEGAQWNKANDLMAKETVPLGRDALERTSEIIVAAEQRNAASMADAASARTAFQWALVIGVLLTIGVSGAVAVMLTQQIQVSARSLADRAQQIAHGDLRGEAFLTQSTDELGELASGFDIMLRNLRDLTSQILSVTENVNSAATQISTSTKQQATSSREQAATVQEITTTMQELSQSGSQIVDKAREVARVVEATTTASRDGIDAMQRTNDSMQAIREQVEEVAENIVALSEKTQAVGEIIVTVTDVAEQSNLLALNAAIEAAAAGTEGNRFSVVASEMKNLADQAKECTAQVRSILSGIQKGINTAVMLTEEAVKRVETGKQQADVSEKSIRQMSETTSRSVQAFQQIIAATNQQQIGFEQVTRGMRDIDEATQQTATGTAQLEQAVVSLSSLSHQLKSAVANYRV